MKHEVSVVICGRSEEDTDNNMNNWIKNNPNDELVLRSKPHKVQTGEKWVGSLVMRSDKEWLPSDLDLLIREQIAIPKRKQAVVAAKPTRPDTNSSADS